MARRIYSFVLEVEANGRIQATIRDPEKRLLGQPWGEFGFKDEISSEIMELHRQAYLRQITEDQVLRLGSALFSSLFDHGPQALRSEFLRVLNSSVIPDPEGVLHLVLDVDESTLPAVASLPWEFAGADSAVKSVASGG